MQIDDEALNLIRQQLLAEQEKTAELKRQNDLAAETLRQAQAEAQLRQIAERNRLKIALDTNEKVAALAEQLPGIFLAIYGIEEWQKEDARWKERQDEISLLILTGKGNGNRARVDELRRELELEHAQRLLLKEVENLADLEEQAAKYGIDKPLKLLNEIRETRDKIKHLERRRSRLSADNT